MIWHFLIGRALGELFARAAAPPRPQVPRCDGCGSEYPSQFCLTLACCGRALCEACADRILVHMDEERAVVRCDRCHVDNTVESDA